MSVRKTTGTLTWVAGYRQSASGTWCSRNEEEPEMMVPTRVIAVATMVVGVAGHGALISPPSRNAVDRFLPECESLARVDRRIFRAWCTGALNISVFVWLLWQLSTGRTPSAAARATAVMVPMAAMVHLCSVPPSPEERRFSRS